MYVGLKQPRGDGERYVTPARAAAKETIYEPGQPRWLGFRDLAWPLLCKIFESQPARLIV